MTYQGQNFYYKYSDLLRSVDSDEFYGYINLFSETKIVQEDGLIETIQKILFTMRFNTTAEQALYVVDWLPLFKSQIIEIVNNTEVRK